MEKIDVWTCEHSHAVPMSFSISSWRVRSFLFTNRKHSAMHLLSRGFSCRNKKMRFCTCRLEGIQGVEKQKIIYFIPSNGPTSFAANVVSSAHYFICIIPMRSWCVDAKLRRSLSHSDVWCNSVAEILFNELWHDDCPVCRFVILRSEEMKIKVVIRVWIVISCYIAMRLT